MILRFDPSTHSYTYRDSAKTGKWTGVTSFIGTFKKPFDSLAVSQASSRKKNSKWYGLPPHLIRELWAAETKRSTDNGSWYHDLQERIWLSLPHAAKFGAVLDIFAPIKDDDGYKISPNQRLIPGIYPEHLVYLESAMLCGQSDLVIVDKDGHVHIEDYKTNKEIKMKSFVNWEGKSDRMSAPLTHLDDCNFNHYALQLSMYLYIILKHNPKLKPGSIKIRHVRFEEEGRDKYNFPILKMNSDGTPIVAEETYYDVPYLKEEVQALIGKKVASKSPVEQIMEMGMTYGMWPVESNILTTSLPKYGQNGVFRNMDPNSEFSKIIRESELEKAKLHAELDEEVQIYQDSSNVFKVENIIPSTFTHKS